MHDPRYHTWLLCWTFARVARTRIFYAFLLAHLAVPHCLFTFLLPHSCLVVSTLFRLTFHLRTTAWMNATHLFIRVPPPPRLPHARLRTLPLTLLLAHPALTLFIALLLPFVTTRRLRWTCHAFSCPSATRFIITTFSGLVADYGAPIPYRDWVRCVVYITYRLRLDVTFSGAVVRSSASSWLVLRLWTWFVGFTNLLLYRTPALGRLVWLRLQDALPAWPLLNVVLVATRIYRV
jgi:hypothetical protein